MLRARGASSASSRRTARSLPSLRLRESPRQVAELLRSCRHGGHGDPAHDGEPRQDPAAPVRARLPDGRAEGCRRNLDRVDRLRHHDEQARRSAHEGTGRDADGRLAPAGALPGAGGSRRQRDRISSISSSPARIGPRLLFASLEFGVRIRARGSAEYISYRGADQPNVAIDDPTRSIRRCSPTPAVGDAAPADYRKIARASSTSCRATSRALETRLTAADKARLDAHLTGTPRWSRSSRTCRGVHGAHAAPAKLDPNDMASFPMIAKTQIDLMMLAHRAG